MNTFLKVVAGLFFLVGFVQLMNALGNGSVLLATLTLLGGLVALTMAAIIDRLDRLVAKP